MLEEPHIPFEYEVLYEDENIIVIDKPHFLATTPRGMWYRETALVRLCERYDEPNITPAHRLDRLTAGVVVFVRNPSARGAYQMLFQNRKTVKIILNLSNSSTSSRLAHINRSGDTPPKL